MVDRNTIIWLSIVVTVLANAHYWAKDKTVKQILRRDAFRYMRFLKFLYEQYWYNDEEVKKEVEETIEMAKKRLS